VKLYLILSNASSVESAFATTIHTWQQKSSFRDRLVTKIAPSLDRESERERERDCCSRLSLQQRNVPTSILSFPCNPSSVRSKSFVTHFGTLFQHHLTRNHYCSSKVLGQCLAFSVTHKESRQFALLKLSVFCFGRERDRRKERERERERERKRERETRSSTVSQTLKRVEGKHRRSRN
jgi:hypothetical protein